MFLFLAASVYTNLTELKVQSSMNLIELIDFTL